MASTRMQVIAHAETDVPQLPYCAYWLHVLDSCALDVPEAQGSLRLGATHCMHAPYVPQTLAPQVIATAGTTRLGT